MDAQKKKTEINQDPIVDQLLNEKRKINNTLSITDQYKIQVFNGTSDLAKKTLTEFKSSNKNLDATIIFQTPNYKVWVGNFRNRMDAERNLIEIRKRYKTAFLIKPGK
ncbi:SPOR domain-containing protein [Flavobacterium sp. LM5]|uniref:SPOR domain-containing protein n=1 Tax=Flavobacterium sp. LM5 TaxID=1938610 RepID=UPI001CB93C5B|nr:SPOR domain-containing protein [Flavobacterium sp. LM5]